MTSGRDKVFGFVKKEYDTDPEYLWEGDFDTAVFRHKDTKKWFGIIMQVKRSTLGIEGEGTADVLNVKCDPLLVDILVQKQGFMRAYHMNKRLWVSILPDEVTDFAEVCSLIDQSYKLTDKKPKTKSSKGK